MKTIKYKMADGSVEEIEVTDEFATEYAKLCVEERRVYRKETRRHISLDMLMEIEEQENLSGSLEKKSLKRNQETYSYISNEHDPLEILLQQEQERNKPLLKDFSLGLTDYQRKIAVEYYANNKTHAQIATELGISRPIISKIIKKVQIRVINKFV